MGYLIGEIPIGLILAALIGAISAWLLRGIRCRVREKELLDELKRTHEKLDGAEGELRRQQASLNDLQVQLEAQTEKLQTRVEQLSAVEATLEKREATVARLESELVQLRDEKEVEIGSLREHIGTLEPLQGQLDKSQAERNRLQGELKAQTDMMKAELQQREGQVERLQQELAGLSEQLDASRAEVERCSRELSTLRATGENEQFVLQNQPAEPETRAQGFKGIPAGQPFERPAAKDDLKEIWGVGPVLEKRLNRLGITTFAQIGRFTAADIERVSGALDVFPGRIVRDGWIEGASKAYQKKYGRKLD